jgi:hypothetical protein
MKYRLKKVQLWLHRNYDNIKHWLIGAILFILLVFSMISIANQNRLIDRVGVLAEQNKILSQQNKTLNTQSKQLGEENQSIAKQNRSYISCVANVFAAFTRDHRPITITNLETCTIDSQTQATNNTTTSGTPTPLTPTTANNQPSQSTPVEKTPTPDSSSTPQPTPDCKVDVLSLHLLC